MREQAAVLAPQLEHAAVFYRGPLATSGYSRA